MSHDLRALTREVSSDLARCELTFLEREPIDSVLAQRQHDNYCKTLEGLGLKVERIPEAQGCPDCCFIEDAAIVLDELAIITHLGAPSRRGESQGVAEALRPYRRLVEMSPPATLDGGDVLRVGRRIFVGLSERTNEAGLGFVKSVAEPLGYSVTALEPRGCLHLKSAVTALEENRVLLNPRWLANVAGLDCVPVPRSEPWAANVLTIGRDVIVHQAFQQTIGLLEREGYLVKPIDVSEFLKAEAGVTCKSLILSSPSLNS